MIRYWGFLQFREQPISPVVQVDLGNGRFVKAEDLLESHFNHRLDAPSLTVHVEGDLNRALAALAPGLASLTELAEEVDHVVPRVQPTPQFRQDLQKALELTHRQHHAQRVLGTRVDTPEAQMPWTIISFVVVVMVCITSVSIYLSRRKVTLSQSSI